MCPTFDQLGVHRVIKLAIQHLLPFSLHRSLPSLCAKLKEERQYQFRAASEPHFWWLALPASGEPRLSGSAIATAHPPAVSLVAVPSQQAMACPWQLTPGCSALFSGLRRQPLQNRLTPFRLRLAAEHLRSGQRFPGLWSVLLVVVLSLGPAKAAT